MLALGVKKKKVHLIQGYQYQRSYNNCKNLMFQSVLEPVITTFYKSSQNYIYILLINSICFGRNTMPLVFYQHNKEMLIIYLLSC